MKLSGTKSIFLIHSFSLILLTFITTIFFCYNNCDGISITILILFIYVTFQMLIGGLNRNITFIAFLVTFFTFLLTRIFIPLFINADVLFIEIGGGRQFNIEIQSFINYALYISLLSVYIGYQTVNKQKNTNHSNHIIPFYNDKRIIRVRKFSKWATFFFHYLLLLILLTR